MEMITSRQNPLCAHFRKLASSRSYREEKGEFLCDSPKLLREALLWGADIHTLLFTEGVDLPAVRDTGIRMVQVSESVMRAVSPMETPQGVVFSCGVYHHELPNRLAPGRYVLLDGVQDPGNVGTILRTADAFGWTAVLLPGCADLYNPKTVRSAMGVHFRRTAWRGELPRAAALVREAGLPLYAAALGDNTVDIRSADLSRCAVIIGSEGQGVSREALRLCDRTLKIPMEQTCESLNAAIAAAVLLWEGARNDGSEEGEPCLH